jgi:hypothetical protein
MATLTAFQRRGEVRSYGRAHGRTWGSSSTSTPRCHPSDGRAAARRRLARAGLLACALLTALVVLPGDARAAGEWVRLFDGKTLDGWMQRNGTANYRVADGAIVGRTREGSPNSFLTTERQYGDFELEFEVRVDDALNSGVQIRSRTRERSTGAGADERAGRVFGPQVEIEASPGLAGFVYGEATGRGWLTPEQHLEPHAHFRNGDWNHYRIVARGPRIRTWLNGQPIEDLTDEETYRSHPHGFIGLQVHGVEPGSGPYEVAWRRLRLRELPASR